MTYPYFNNPYTQVEELLVKPWREVLKSVLDPEVLDPEVLDPRTLATRAATNYKVTGELDDFVIATVIEAFLRLKADEASLTRSIETMLEHPIDFYLGFTLGFDMGVLKTLWEVLKGYWETITGLMEFFEELEEIDRAYRETILDLETMTKIVLALMDMEEEGLDETLERIYEAIAAKHSDFAMVILDGVDRLNRLLALRQLFKEIDSQIIKGIITDLGEALSAHWQSDIDRYLAFKEDAFDLGREIGRDYGRLSAEIASLVVGI